MFLGVLGFLPRSFNDRSYFDVLISFHPGNDADLFDLIEMKLEFQDLFKRRSSPGSFPSLLSRIFVIAGSHIRARYLNITYRRTALPLVRCAGLKVFNTRRNVKSFPDG